MRVTARQRWVEAVAVEMSLVVVTAAAAVGVGVSTLVRPTTAAYPSLRRCAPAAVVTGRTCTATVSRQSRSSAATSTTPCALCGRTRCVSTGVRVVTRTRTAVWAGLVATAQVVRTVATAAAVPVCTRPVLAVVSPRTLSAVDRRRLAAPTRVRSVGPHRAVAFGRR